MFEEAAGLLFDNLLNGAAYCRVIFDGDEPVDFLCLRTNPAFIRHTRLELQHKRGTEVLPSLREQHQALLTAFARVSLGNGSEQFCYFLPELGNWFELSVFSPKPEHFVAVINLIREQLERPRVARKHDQFWRATLAAMSDAVFVCDRDGELVEMNEAFVGFHRLQGREEFPRSPREYSRFLELRTAAGEFLPPASWPVSRALRGESGVGLELHLRRPDAGMAWIGSYDFAPIWNHAGNIVGALMVARDITAQVAREHALQSAWNELSEMKRALAAVDIAVYRLEPVHGHIVDADALMLERLGYPLAELQRLAPWEVDLSVTEASTPVVLSALRTTGSLRAEALHKTKDGREIPVEVLVYHQPASGDGPGSLLAFARDLSARRQREAVTEQLRLENHRLAESTVAALTASAIAHELNQPLTVVALSAATALNLLEAGPSAENQLRAALAATLRSAERAGEAVRELVGLLQKRPSRSEALNLCALVRRVLRRFRSGLAHEQHLVANLCTGDALVTGNRMQLEKVLANLLQNGFDAMADAPPPRRLHVRVRLAPGGNAARISVADHGTGLSAAQLAQVFEPFYTTKASGLGMGLAVCEAVVREHQGRIWARSKPGKGSIFHVELPIAAGSVSGLTGAGAPQAETG